MARGAQKIYIDSPVFTHEDEERFHYVDTEVDGLASSQAEDDGKFDFETLVNGSCDPQVSVGRHRSQTGTETASKRCNSVMRDSLEDDFSDSNVPSNHKGRIVVADLSRYEDVTMRTNDRCAVAHPARRNRKSDHVVKRGMSKVQPGHFYLHDDVEEYEEAQLERQHQRQEARRAHVPHLQLSHSDDDPSDGAAELDLEINDGRGTHSKQQRCNSQKNASRANPHRVSFGTLPGHCKLGNTSQLMDSLEVAECHNTGADRQNPDCERSLYADQQVYSKNEPHDSEHNSTNSHHSVYRDTKTRRHGDFYYDVLAQQENHQAHAAVQNSSAKRQQLFSRLQPTSGPVQIPHHSSDSQPQAQTSSDVRRRPDEGATAVDFVEANRHNVNKKQQKTYGQIHLRKKGKENTVDSERSTRQRPAEPLASVLSHQTEDVVQPLSEQNPEPPSSEVEESNALTAEQVWQARSQSLAARKESAESGPGKNRRGRTVLAQDKVPRDVRVNNSRPVVPPTTSSAPHHHHPSAPARLLPPAVPQQYENPGSSPQKVSVDCNLNVLSPRPSLNQPSTSLPVQYTGPHLQDVYQYSSRTPAYSNATGQYHHYQTTSQPPLADASQLFTDSRSTQCTVAMSPSYTVLSHWHSAPQFLSSGYQQPMPHYVDAQGQLIPHQPVPQQLPVRYNYGYPQPSPVQFGDTSQPLFHPYQMQVCCITLLLFCPNNRILTPCIAVILCIITVFISTVTVGTCEAS